jgi:hypothetical protein
MSSSTAFVSPQEPRRRSTRILQRQEDKGSNTDTEHHVTSNGVSNAGAAKLASDTPDFTIGLLADIQYAPIPDGFSFSGSQRFYRHALETAKHAAEHFEQDKVDLVLNLG